MGSKKREDGLPRKFVFLMKKKKNKKIRNTPIEEVVIEKMFNNSRRII